MRTILSETKAISSKCPAIFTVKDDVGGDMVFTFKLVYKDDDGQQSYTRFIVKDSHSGEIQISNAPQDKSIRLADWLKVGEYKDKDKLFVSFSLTQILEDDFRNISVLFAIKEEA